MSWVIMTSTLAANCCTAKGDPRKVQMSWKRLEVIHGLLKAVPDEQLHDGDLVAFTNPTKIRGSYYCYFDCEDDNGLITILASRDFLLVGVTRVSEVENSLSRFKVSKKIGFHHDVRGEWI